MATYFGYVEREADSYVNWADVGRNMSATIDNIQRVRDEKKALIEKAYREDLDYIQAIPSGEHKTVRDWSIGFGNDAAENLKLKYSLLKQGKSSVKDFTSFRENITNDTESLYTTINNIQTAYKEKMDRFKAGDNQDLEMADMAQLERFGNLSDTKSFINGLTGSVGIGLTEEVEVDGKKVRALKKGDDAYLTVQQLVAAVNRKYDNYDVRPDIAKWVEGFGEKIKSLRQFGSEIKAGSIIEVMDITNEELMKQATALGYTEGQINQIQKSIDDFKKAEDLYLKGLMVDNPYHTLATLNKRLNYQPTFSKEEAAANDNMVYCERDASGAAIPKFTKKQEKAVFDYMKGQARLMYDEKVKLTSITEPRPERAYGQFNESVWKYGKEEEQIRADAQLLGEMYYGTPSQMVSSLDWVKSKPNVFDVRNSYYNDATGELIITPLDQPPIVTKLYDVDAQGNITGEYKGKDKISSKDFVTRILGYVHPGKNPATFRDMVPDKPVGAQPVTGAKAQKQKRLQEVYDLYDKMSPRQRMSPEGLSLYAERIRLEKELGGAFFKKGQGPGGKATTNQGNIR